MAQVHPAVLIAAACLALAPIAAAQQPAERRLDSLEAQLRVLRTRLDSALAALARPQLPQDTAPADDLAALRAAAATAIGRPDTARADTAPTVFIGRERNLSLLNPEISVTGDVRGYAYRPGIQRDNFDPREFEFAFQSALDPYSHTKIFVSVEDGEVDVEEAYAYWTGLPGRLRADVGRFRQQLGELNRWHLHALPETEYPLALVTYAGEDGLTGDGLSVYWALPTSGTAGTHELWAQVTRGTNALLFDGAARPAFLGHLNNFWQLNRSTYAQLGATGVYGTDPATVLRTRLGGLDVRLTWRPPARALYREWTLRGELYALTKERAGVGETRFGGYLGTTYKLGRRWVAGLRYDYVEAAEGALSIVRQVVPSLTLWQSEWVYLRAQYVYSNPSSAAATHQLALQAVWSMGPHKHEIY